MYEITHVPMVVANQTYIYIHADICVQDTHHHDYFLYLAMKAATLGSPEMDSTRAVRLGYASAMVVGMPSRRPDVSQATREAMSTSATVS